MSLNDFENGLLYFKKSYDLKTDNGITYELDLTLANIGVCYNSLGRVEEAIKNFKQALDICKPDCADQRLKVIYAGLGESFLKLNRLDEAEEQFRLAIESAAANGSAHFGAIALNGLAKVYEKKGDINSAITFLGRSQALVEGSDLSEDILNNYELYAHLYTRQGKESMALEFQSKYIQLNKKIFGGKLIKNILGIQSEYEERKNLKILKAKDQLITLQESQSQLQRIIIVISIVLLLLLIGLAMLLWKMIKMKNNTNLLLDQKVRSRTQELEESYKQLERASLKQQESMDNLNYRMRSSMATLKGITEVAKKDIEDPKGLNYISKIESEAEKLNQASPKK
jgi:tetratricopeptide (TPR) repeat protein